MKTKLRNQKGFTIIEVLIVLAIAGLILLIVFLAVPALQRNSRNTQRKNDVAALLAGVAEYANNNSGVLPVSTTPPTFAVPPNLIWAAPAGLTSSQVKLGYYTQGVGVGVGNVELAANGALVAGGVYIDAPHDRVTVTPSTSCGAANAVVAGSARSVTAVYEVETGNGTFAQACQGS